MGLMIATGASGPLQIVLFMMCPGNRHAMIASGSAALSAWQRLPSGLPVWVAGATCAWPGWGVLMLSAW